jgi:hypothetical protein
MKTREASPRREIILPFRSKRPRQWILRLTSHIDHHVHGWNQEESRGSHDSNMTRRPPFPRPRISQPGNTFYHTSKPRADSKKKEGRHRQGSEPKHAPQKRCQRNARERYSNPFPTQIDNSPTPIPVSRNSRAKGLLAQHLSLQPPISQDPDLDNDRKPRSPAVHFQTTKAHHHISLTQSYFSFQLVLYQAFIPVS